jgi:LacI family transcriptional regulator
MGARIQDVAAAAAVSIKTVSRVLNREPNVREDTRQRVLEAVQKLQYKPNPSARSLAGQRSYVVALVYDNPSRNYLMEIQSGMLEACHANHYNLVLGPLGQGGRRTHDDIEGLFGHFGPEGVVLIPPLTDDPLVLAYLQEHGVPFACVSPRNADGRIGVTMDEQAAVDELMAHLFALGHRRIGHIQGHPSHGACTWRHSAYRDALAQAGIAYDPDLVVPGEFVFESGVRGGNQLLDLREPPTAIFAANDDMAAGVIHAATKRGLAMPRDLSVCGFDDTPIARHICPTLTTVRQPTAAMGRLATEQLLLCLHDPASARMVAVRHSLIVRESTGPASRRAG